MKRIVVMFAAVLLVACAGCGGSAKVSAPAFNGAFAGHWVGVSVDGAPLPYSYTISTSIFRITKRVLDVYDYSATGYRDDAMTQTVNGQTNDLSGSGLSDILVVGSSMTVTR